jgi:phenylacetic acid degradation operon negative regulatory protein
MSNINNRSDINNRNNKTKDEKKFSKEKRKRKINDISWGLVKTLTDLVLLQLFLASSMIFKSRYSQKGIKELFDESQDIDWRQIRQTLTYLKKEGIVSYTRSRVLEPRITNLGIKRLRKILPVYDIDRPWDKKVYLITYDISEEQRQKRDLLREGLETIGCGKLQDSVWITCYNPQKLVAEFIRKHNIEGSVIVSVIGKDGSIGREDLKDLISRVYKLNQLNDKYRDFIDKIKQDIINNSNVGFAYLSILQDDPQLPFELLPDDWLGEKAYFIYRKLVKQIK